METVQEETRPAESVKREEPGPMACSREIDQIASALAAAQKDYKEVARDQKVNAGKYSYSYAPLEEIIGAVRPALAENGIAITSSFEEWPDRMKVSTTLLHKSGQWLKASVTFGNPLDPQAKGSNITYGRRYTLQAVAGIQPHGEDDDGAAGKRHADARSMKGVPIGQTQQRPAKQQQKPAGKANEVPAEEPADPSAVLNPKTYRAPSKQPTQWTYLQKLRHMLVGMWKFNLSDDAIADRVYRSLVTMDEDLTAEILTATSDLTTPEDEAVCEKFVATLKAMHEAGWDAGQILALGEPGHSDEAEPEPEQPVE